MAIDHPWIGIDAIIRNNEGAILLLRRARESKAFPDMWSLLSGKVEWGEEVKAAVIREVKEETSLDVKVIKFTGKYYDKIGRHPLKTMVCLPHHCEIIGGEIRLDKENSEYGWFMPEEIRKMDLAFDHKKMLTDERLI